MHLIFCCATALGILLATLLSSTPSASAALIASEQMSYAPPGATLLGQDGGTGFSGEWFASGFNASRHDNYVVGDGSLVFHGLKSEGNRVSSPAVPSIAGLARSLADPIGPTEDATRYFSLLLRPEGVLGAGAFNGFFGVYLDGTGNSDLFFGKPGSTAIGNYVLENRGGLGPVRSDVVPEVGRTALLVVRGEFRLGPDRFTMYVNPDPRAGEPAQGVVKTDLDVGAVSALTIYSTGAFSLDALRIGETFADVLPSTPPGDTNSDGMVDIDDLNNVRNQFGRRGRPDGSLLGDTAPFDGMVNIDDLNAVRNNFGAGTVAVPEPGGMLTGAALLLTMNRRRQRGLTN